jgi:cell division septal protein FtsQ
MGRLVFLALFLFIGISTSTFFSPLKTVDFRGFHHVLVMEEIQHHLGLLKHIETL